MGDNQALLSFISGAAQGFTQKKLMEMKKTQTPLEKVKVQYETKKLDILNSLMQNQLAQQQTTPVEPIKPEKHDTVFGDSFELGSQEVPAPSVVDSIVANQGFGDMTPEQAAVIKEVTGIDMLGAERLKHEKNKAGWRNLGDKLVATDPYGNPIGKEFKIKQKQVPITVTEPGGVEKTLTYDPIQGLGEGLVTKSKKGKTSEVAGKLVTARSGIKVIRNTRNNLIKNDGTVDRVMLAAMSSRFPGTKGRQLFDEYYSALDAKIRVMTGAAITREEQPMYERMFAPSSFDSDEQIKSKMDRLESFLSSYKDELAPGETVDERKSYVWNLINNSGAQSGRPADDYLKSIGY